MLARLTKISHPTGGVIDLPRLVPAFSSKGFPFKPKSKLSQATLALELVGHLIKNSILISAYDLFHGHLKKPGRFFGDKELIFVDSGGYELSSGFDQTEPVHWESTSKDFSGRDYVDVLRTLPKDLPFVISNYDWGTRDKSLVAQILTAQKLFARFPNFLSNFIIKPGRDGKHIEVDDVIRHISKIRAFHILGITEKELGKDLIDRLRNIAKLRLAMDREDIRIPIHVWGGLDPLLTPLYFLAGAEIFDGISWLRYAYIEGVAVYRDSYAVLEEGIETSFDQARALTLNHNLTFLTRLETSFHEFVLQGGRKFDMFENRSTAIERAYRALVTKVPQIDGGR